MHGNQGSRFDLTIAIPTFNRPQCLEEVLTILGPQLSERVELLVIDNASPLPASVIAEKVFGRLLRPGVRIERNLSNIGGNANIMRCVELARGDYVWLLGDDDHPTDCAVEIILKGIANNREVAFFSYYSASPFHRKRTISKKIMSAAGYVDACESIGEMLFISNLVLRARDAQPHLVDANHWQATCAPQLITCIRMLENGGTAVLSDSRLLQSLGHGRASERIEIMYMLALAPDLLLLVPWGGDVRKALSKKLNSVWVIGLKLTFVLEFLCQLTSTSMPPNLRSLFWEVFRMIRTTGFATLAIKLIYLLAWIASYFPKVLLRPVISWLQYLAKRHIDGVRQSEKLDFQ